MAQLAIYSDPYLNFRNAVAYAAKACIGTEELLKEINIKLREYHASVSYRSFNVIFDSEQDLTVFLLKWA